MSHKHDYEFREQGETKKGRLFNIYRCRFCGNKKRKYARRIK